MKVTGFTFVRNALIYDLPIVQAITSILPVCTDFVIAVGQSDDDTLELVRSIRSPKIRIIETIWDEHLREGGKVLAVETAKAMDAIDADSDWCFYIQADEVLHEDRLGPVTAAMHRYRYNSGVDGLLFRYLHFYGSYEHIGISPSLYKKEIRIIRNDKSIYPWRDAQGFRKGINEKLAVKNIDADIYHYGCVKDPKAMQRKHEDFGKLWGKDAAAGQSNASGENFDYHKNKRPISRFCGTHPAVMQEKIGQQHWDFDPAIAHRGFTFKERLKILLEERLGLNLSYTNYRLID